MPIQANCSSESLEVVLTVFDPAERILDWLAYPLLAPFYRRAGKRGWAIFFVAEVTVRLATGFSRC
jgi:hypothetical protein